MTYMDLLEAIAARISTLWPNRMLYRDFCPVDHQRPSGFLYVQETGFTDAGIGLVRWTFQAELELFAETDTYDLESTEVLRADQAAVLGLFGGPAIAVADRHIGLNVAADTPGPGSAYVRFSASWMDERPGYQDAEAYAPLMEHYALNINGKE